ncbi:DUF11 domain-containing protein [Candidatus Saccharibacteria bacterium]|nr:DUF11 domain-containing protein [Candidatus Saccharibacteria bacterium]
MFRKIISNITFSPALVGQLGFYAKRLRKEEATRRLGLIFVVLALIVQALAVFQPPESANASNQNDFVSGGLGYGANKSLNNFLAPYDANSKNLRDVMNYTGITRQEIASTKYTYWAPGKTLSWGYQSRFSAAQGEKTVKVTGASGKAIVTVYARPMTLYGYNSTSKIYGWVGHSQKMGWFAIMQACGNLVTTKVPQPPAPPKVVVPPRKVVVVPPPKVVVPPRKVVVVPPPEVVVPPPTIEKIIQSKSAVNLSRVSSDDSSRRSGDDSSSRVSSDDSSRRSVDDSSSRVSSDDSSRRSVDATTVIAKGNDQIKYTITARNAGNALATVKLEEQLADVLEYSRLTDNGGGTFNESTTTLVWPDVELPPGGEATRIFVVRILADIPATAQGISDPSSYNCIMTNVFGNAVTINVSCDTPKVVEQVVSELPKTGPSENIAFAGVELAIAAYFYARTRQVKKEVRLIRRSLNTGTI